MARRLRTGAATSLVLAALLAVAFVLLGAGTAQAVPQSLPMQVSFTDLRPGEVRSTSWPVRIPQRARISQAVLRLDGPGDVRWTARLCPVGGAACVDVMTAAVGTPIAAGDYVLAVGLQVVEMQPGMTQSLEGRYMLVQDDDGVLADTSGSFGRGGSRPGHGGSLAATGLSVLSLGAMALSLGALGVVLVAIVRRRRDSERPDVPRAEGAP